MPASSYRNSWGKQAGLYEYAVLEQSPFAKNARYARWLRGTAFARRSHAGLPAVASERSERFGEGWRRGWDSNSKENPRKCLNHNDFNDLTRSRQNRQNRENR